MLSLFTKPVARRACCRRPRRGLAVAELAVGLPVLLLIAMGTMEACTMIRVSEKLNTIAYEGARIGVLPDAESDNVQWQCGVLEDEYGLHSVDVALSHDPQSLAPGDWLTVTVSVPFSDNALVGGWMMPDVHMNESVTLQVP